MLASAGNRPFLPVYVHWKKWPVARRCQHRCVHCTPTPETRSRHAEIPDMSHGLSEVFDPRYFQRTRYGTLRTGSCQTCTNDWRRDVVFGPSLQVVNSRLVHQSPKWTMSSLSLPDLKVRFEGSSCCSQCWRSRRTACQARNSLPSGLFSLICG